MGQGYWVKVCACRAITMQGFIVLAIIGTEKLIVTEIDGRFF